MNDNIFIGIDPDTRNVSAAILYPDNRVDVILFKVPAKVKTPNECLGYLANNLTRIQSKEIKGNIHIFVEMQSASYTTKKGANPNDLLALANAGGITAHWVAENFNSTSVTFVTASEWKGSIPKRVSHYRTLQDLGIDTFVEKGGQDPYLVPTNYEKKINISIISEGKLNDSDWKDVLDSIGLALYGKSKGLNILKIKGKV